MEAENPVTVRKRVLWSEYEDLRALKLNLNLARGNPCPEQLDLSLPMLGITEYMSPSGVDCRNYSKPDLLAGLPEMRKLAARYLGADPRYTLVGNNSSLTLMHDVIVRLRMQRWSGEVSMLCPTPGYDRYHAICATYGIRMIPIPMRENGPDLAAVRSTVKERGVVGMWCNPRYHNPTGVTFSPKVVGALARMETANPNFILMWDDAYAGHHLAPKLARLPGITKECQKLGNENRPFVFGSFSKVTFAGSGLAFMATSKKNFEWFLEGYRTQTIGPDKLNQLRHLLFLKDMRGLRAHMRKHRKILLPKFRALDEALQKQIGGKGIARWEMPDGGYFFSFSMEKGKASRVWNLMKGIGIEMTPVGAAFPYGNDPQDSHLRLAPTACPLPALSVMGKALGVCAEIAHFEEWPQTR